MDCRVETKVSPRNDGFWACHVMLVATVGVLACGDSAYIFFSSARKALSSVRKFSKCFMKINLLNGFLQNADGEGTLDCRVETKVFPCNDGFGEHRPRPLKGVSPSHLYTL